MSVSQVSYVNQTLISTDGSIDIVLDNVGNTDLTVAGGSGGSVTVSDTAPASPTTGALWWDSIQGALKIYYQDQDSSQWVDASSILVLSDGGVGVGGSVAGSVRYDFSQSLTSINKAQAQSNMGLATVASSGSYTDLSNKPDLSVYYLATNPSGFITSSALAGYALSSSLATVATSGSYTDLSNKPTIPAAQIQSNWTQTSDTALDYIKNKPTLFDGAYASLTGKPDLSIYYLASNPSGFISSITSSDVTTALGFTPYNATNPSGFITSSALTGYALSSSLSTVATSGSYADLINKPVLFDGAYNSLTGKPTLFSGAFADLTGKPTTLSGYGITDAQVTLESGTNIKTVNGTSVLGAGNIVTPTETTASIVTKLSTAAAISDVSGNVRSIPQNSKTSTYVLVATDNGKHISITTGGVIVPFSVFAAGDTVMIVNNSAASQTISQSSSLTLRWAGQTTAQTGDRTLGLYGIATILFISPTVAFISGAGLS